MSQTGQVLEGRYIVFPNSLMMIGLLLSMMTMVMMMGLMMKLMITIFIILIMISCRLDCDQSQSSSSLSQRRSAERVQRDEQKKNDFENKFSNGSIRCVFLCVDTKLYVNVPCAEENTRTHKAQEKGDITAVKGTRSVWNVFVFDWKLHIFKIRSFVDFLCLLCVCGRCGSFFS